MNVQPLGALTDPAGNFRNDAVLSASAVPFARIPLRNAVPGDPPIGWVVGYRVEIDNESDQTN
ncbi:MULTISPECIES: DUF4436 family protein [unclassified Mycolicibacterium]|uniref:DUF4436 family protein n=1 Tax=unclassified Mycolicibacterium TaxID=2636767 RepID=UPI0012DF1512|nr:MULTISPECIES: DUF4436 family protein [unclassified Mycolicibacterium]MUL80698.1 DUF4436 domain-containing protein [Mycolicibacterium sp. CBMA 329]MUL86465.1 DUF4436 domain-containing protein [Mycolicibacterium sp. CBMA 331]MUM01327.1 DUF4436 domain-containing protein [Mycolicibacterium sp. CBMA 334]MUM25837.1 DUF4436 domain-containing protein [Mycolicibacterium sp. CBMA 295]MUM36761.1 DUF4436 domain-containing protein [Mycolicibacterium sp. CBMA 247]